MREVLVWDWPLRVFHWALAILVSLSILTGQIGGNWMVWHGRFGIAIAGLLGFRIAWGFLGSTHARFASFVRGPAAILDYLRGSWQGLGHNPLGALSVLGMLAVLIFQVGTGLFGNDDIAFNGPLYALVDKAQSDLAIGWHKTLFWVLVALLAAHLGAIAFYTRVKRESLIEPMLTGRKKTAAPRAENAKGGGWVALLIAVAIGAAIGWMAAGGLLPAPAPVDTGFNW